MKQTDTALQLVIRLTGKLGRTSVSLSETQEKHIHTKTGINNTSGHAQQAHTGAQAHASTVILSGSDSEESLPNVLLLDNLRKDR